MQGATSDAAGREASLVVICYVTVYLVWGSTYFFIRQAVLTIPPFYVVGLRWTVGGALLLYNGRSIRTTLDASVLIGLAGVLSWSFATSLGHRFPVHGDNLVNSGIQMLFVGVVSLAGSLIFDRPPAAVIAGASILSALSVLYLAVIGAIAFAAYTFLVSREPAERVVSYALVNPLIALLLGLGLGKETATPFLWIGVPLVLLALVLMLYGEKALARLRGPRPREPRRKAEGK